MAIKQLISHALTHYSGQRTQERTTDRPLQTGALPWRMGRKKRLEVLLVTGRRSRRWTIPKGWPIAGKTLAEAAAQEAFEEAGVRGTIDPVPVGSFDHTKQNLPTGLLDVRILVHPLSVDRELAKWPEVGQRRRKWFSVEDAAKKVDSEELRALIMISAERALADRRKNA
jgi:8-oxo-dGTP pyrophosphatase MutT (NUDIX family)